MTLASHVILGVIAGSDGGGVIPPPPGGTSTITLTNLNSSTSFAQPTVRFGLSFAPGDIPAGESIGIKDSTDTNITSVQQDAESSSHPDGSLAQAVVSIQMSETVAPLTTKNYTWYANPSPPDTTLPAGWSNPEAKMAMVTDVKAIVTDAETSATYTVSLNDIFANFDPYPWGTSNPAGGYTRVASGPNCVSWEAWKFLKNDNTGLYQGYVKCYLDVTYWPATSNLEVEIDMEMENVGDTITTTSEQYRVSPKRFLYTVVIKDGSTVIANIGGPNDTRATTVANSAFDTVSGNIKGAFTSYNNAYDGLPVMFSSSGVLPQNLQANTAYFLAWQNGGPYGATICTERVISGSVATTSAYPAWAPGTNYSGILQTVFAAVVRANNQLFYCNQSGTSASSGPGPSGYGTTISDNNITWKNANISVASQGTGTITIYPVCAIFQQCGRHHCNTDFEAFWSGTGTRPKIVAGQPISYLKTTKATPPYSDSFTPTNSTGHTLPSYADHNPFSLTWNLNGVGDNAGDQRIGPINEFAAAGEYLPTDPYYYDLTLLYAMSQKSAPHNLVDETDGLPLCANNGPSKNGTPYPNRATPLPNWVNPTGAGVNTGWGRGNWLPQTTTSARDISGESGYFGNQQGRTNFTHTPRLVWGAYRRTGRRWLWRTLRNQAVFSSAAANYRQQTVLGTTYYMLAGGINQLGGTIFPTEARGEGWQFWTILAARWLCPDSDPCKSYLDDICSDNAAYLHAWYNTSNGQVNAAQRTLGIQSVANHQLNSTQSPWMCSFIHSAWAWAAWQKEADEPGWGTAIDFREPFYTVLFNGLGLWAIGQYNIFYGPKDAEVSLTNYGLCYQTQAELLGTTGLANFNITGEIGADINGSISGNTLTVNSVSAGNVTVGDVVSYSGSPANLRINSGSGPTYTLSASPGNVSNLPMTIKSGAVYATIVPAMIYDHQSFSAAGIPGGTQIFKNIGGGTGTGGVGSYYLGDGQGTLWSPSNYLRMTSRSFALYQNDAALPTWPGPTQPWMTDGFGGRLNDSYPYSCNSYVNMARTAVACHALARPSNTTLATMNAALNSKIAATTGSSAPGGIAFYGTDPADGFKNTCRPTFACGF